MPTARRVVDAFLPEPFPEQFGALVKAELVKWKGVVQRAKLSAD